LPTAAPTPSVLDRPVFPGNSGSLIRRALVLSVLLAASRAAADFPEPPAPDADEMFARGAEALDACDVRAADAAFARLFEKFPLPAWKARIDFFRARRILDRAGPADAVAALSSVDARPIGLDGYRQFFLGQALERAHRPGEAGAAYVLAARSESADADRALAAIAAARLARSRAEKREALAALEGAASAASGDQRPDLFAARGRLAAELGNDDALERTAAEMIELDPALLFDTGIPPALSREARRQEAALSDSRQLALAERLFEAGQTTAAAAESREVAGETLAPGEKRRWRLLLARIQQRLGKIDASDREAQRVGPGAPEEGSAALVTAENALRRALTRRGKGRRNIAIRELSPAAARRIAGLFHLATSEDSRAETRMRGFRSEVILWVAAEDIPAALDAARRMTALDAGATWGFEALWKAPWEKIEAGDPSGALEDIGSLASIYHEISAARRLRYWSARCYEKLGKAEAAGDLGHELSCANPSDLYARFAAQWRTPCSSPVPPEPPENSGAFGRVDELLRLRFYPEARREADRLTPSRGRELRRAVAAFALGDFASATGEVKAAYPQIGTVLEGEVPEQWRRLYYPIATGGIVEAAAREFGVDPSVFRAIVRQESAYNARARSRAGAAGLTQLMPGTARLLSRTVLKKRFRTAFLYDPATNVRLGASYMRQLLDRFDNDVLMALAAYNAGPGRIGGFLRDHPELSADERLEALPFAETRDYVRRVFLYSESYRELYPDKEAPGAPK
jgi:soluble lytic murein transglycosylase-like protein